METIILTSQTFGELGVRIKWKAKYFELQTNLGLIPCSIAYGQIIYLWQVIDLLLSLNILIYKKG